jgi:hypothetical protein
MLWAKRKKRLHGGGLISVQPGGGGNEDCDLVRTKIVPRFTRGSRNFEIDCYFSGKSLFASKKERFLTLVKIS